MFNQPDPVRPAVVGCLFTVGLSLLAGCTPNVKDMRAEGIEQFRCKQNIESMATFRHILELSPNDAQSNYYMGLNYRSSAERKFREGDVTAARRELDTSIIYFTQAIKSWPNYMAAVSAKDDALKARGKYDEALTVAERVADNNRGEAEHFVYLGNEYRDRADYDNALRAYKLALSTDPNCSQAYAVQPAHYPADARKSLQISLEVVCAGVDRVIFGQSVGVTVLAQHIACRDLAHRRRAIHRPVPPPGRRQPAV
jgi:tetratricopeptide (TPR) repeat protein